MNESIGIIGGAEDAVQLSSFDFYIFRMHNKLQIFHI